MMDDHRERVDKPFHVWMMISSDKFSFRWDHILRTGGSVEWSGRRVLSNFKRAGKGTGSSATRPAFGRRGWSASPRWSTR